MFRPRHFITVVAVCMMAAGCTSRDDGRVNMEILLSTVWGAFHARHTAEHRSGEGCGIRPVPLYIRRRRHPVGLRRRRGRDRLGARRTTAVHLHPQSRGDGDRFIRNVHRTGDIGRAAVAGGGHRQPRPSVPCGHGRGSGKGTSCGASAQRTKEINDALEKPHSHVGRHPGTLSAPVL